MQVGRYRVRQPSGLDRIHHIDKGFGSDIATDVHDLFELRGGCPHESFDFDINGLFRFEILHLHAVKRLLLSKSQNADPLNPLQHDAHSAIRYAQVLHHFR